MSSRKRGPLSQSEIQVLEQNFATSTNEELADRIGRTVATVAKWRAKHDRGNVVSHAETGAIEDELRKEYFWEEVCEQFNETEQRRFAARWVEMCRQFGDSVVATDKMQMVALIKTQLLHNRCMKTERETLDEMDNIKSRVMAIERLPIGSPDRDDTELFNLQNRYNELVALQGLKYKEQKELQSTSESLFKSLKLTRDQRIKKIEDNKVSFFDMIAALDEQSVREREGRQMELVKVAAQNAREDLSENTEFEDGTVDRCILTTETAMQDEE